MQKINKTLKERSKVYGNYTEGINFRADMMKLIKARYKDHHGTELNEVDYLSIFDIINKISRLAITPSHLDSWHDISG